jgi:hypothetical protein
MSEEDIPEIRKQLLALRAITQTTGALHEAQVVNLKYWIRIAVAHSTSAEIAYFQKERDEKTGLITQEPVIEFRVVLGKGKPPKDFKKRLAGLNRSIKDLLGPDFGVRVKSGKTLIYESKGKSISYAQEQNE